MRACCPNRFRHIRSNQVPCPRLRGHVFLRWDENIYPRKSKRTSLLFIHKIPRPFKGRKKGMVLSTSFASLHPWLLFMKPYKLLDSLMRGQFSLLRIIDESHSINRFNTKYVLLFIRGYIISIEQHTHKGAGLPLLTSRTRQ